MLFLRSLNKSLLGCVCSLVTCSWARRFSYGKLLPTVRESRQKLPQTKRRAKVTKHGNIEVTPKSAIIWAIVSGHHSGQDWVPNVFSFFFTKNIFLILYLSILIFFLTSVFYFFLVQCFLYVYQASWWHLSLFLLACLFACLLACVLSSTRFFSCLLDCLLAYSHRVFFHSCLRSCLLSSLLSSFLSFLLASLLASVRDWRIWGWCGYKIIVQEQGCLGRCLLACFLASLLLFGLGGLGVAYGCFSIFRSKGAWSIAFFLACLHAWRIKGSARVLQHLSVQGCLEHLLHRFKSIFRHHDALAPAACLLACLHALFRAPEL